MLDFFLADDLSGALDAAAAFHHAGRRVRIVLSAGKWTRQPDDEVIGVTTETRNASAADAASAVARAIAHGHAQGARLVYKKIDSTLRGAVAAEVSALAKALPETRILFAPANPGVGRTVRDGVLLVRGVPVAETEFARDPVTPVKESSIRRLLGEAASSRMVIADTETEEDLARVVAQMEATGDAWVGIGSGALARPVAARRPRTTEEGEEGRSQESGADSLGRRREATGLKNVLESTIPTPDPRLLTPGSCLMICGSAHPGNREQATVLARERGVPIHDLRLDGSADAIAFALRSFATHRGATLLIEPRRGDSAGVVRMIAQTAATILAQSCARRVFITGGETAFALCRGLDVASLTFCAEIEAGLSVSQAASAEGGVVFAVKPGGFGDVHTWVRAWDALVVT